jgi:hypothetical protein
LPYTFANIGSRIELNSYSPSNDPTMLNLFSAFRKSKVVEAKTQSPASTRSPGASPRIFISYRRADSAPYAGRIFDRLSGKYGSGNVFMDIDAIPLGSDFGQVVINELRQCDALFAIIGHDWLGRRDSYQKARIDDPNDFVRMELEAALQLRIPIIPVLVGGATMPSSKDLPRSLAELASRNAATVDEGMDFHRDMDRLITAVDALLIRTSHERSTPLAPPPEIEPADLAVNQVFVSHATEDRHWVESEVVLPLNGNGIKTWYSTKSIASAAQWEREILKGLESCDWFLIVVSLASSKSEWVKDELFWAMSHRPTRIVPVIYQMCDLWKFHIRLPRLQYVDFADRAVAREKLLTSFSDNAAAMA